jgi:hypothetical protein
MARPIKSKQFYDANTGLLLFVLRNDSVDYLENPELWIKNSNLWLFHKKSIKNKKFKSIRSLKNTKIDALADEISKSNSQVAQAKANKTLMFKLWAINYYMNGRRLRGIASKSYWAKIIHKKLSDTVFSLKTFTGDIAEAGQIPSEYTIRTEWLKKI